MPPLMSKTDVRTWPRKSRMARALHKKTPPSDGQGCLRSALAGGGSVDQASSEKYLIVRTIWLV